MVKLILVVRLWPVRSLPCIFNQYQPVECRIIGRHTNRCLETGRHLLKKESVKRQHCKKEDSFNKDSHIPVMFGIKFG